MLVVADHRKLHVVTVTRLTLSIARRGELARVTLEEFDAARKDEWRDRHHTVSWFSYQRIYTLY